MSKQTALKWYIEQCENIKYNPLEKNGYTIAKEKITKQALQMEREQKIEFAKKCLDKALDLDIRTAHSKVEEYYNETYGVKGRENKSFMSEEEWVKEYTGKKGRDIGESEYGDYR
jgi:hypothetical protein